MSDENVYGFGIDTLPQGDHLNLGVFRGLPLLVVNVGSTGRYREQIRLLQEVHEAYGSLGLTVVGVPSFDFGGERGGLADVVARYTYDFRTTFLLSIPARVGGQRPCPLYRMLTLFESRPVLSDAEKFVIDGEGYVSARFGSEVSPKDPTLLAALKFVLPTMGY